jgi:copper chaperone
LENEVIVVKNMGNETDANKVLEAIEHVWGLLRAEVHLSQKEAVFSYDERMASAQDFKQAVVEAGFDIGE